jgi:hypothetical protein
MSDYVYVVMDIPWDPHERPVIHGVFDNCLGAMAAFNLVVNDFWSKTSATACKDDRPKLIYFPDVIAHVEIMGGTYDKHCISIERVELSRSAS